MARRIIDAARVRELLDYNPETGILFWRNTTKGRGSRIKAGDVAVTEAPDGYLKVHIDRKAYQAHRVAFVWMTGAMPIYDIDHIDGNRTNNRWNNLRDVTSAVNAQNLRSAKSNSASGLLGVSWSKECNKWAAYIMAFGNAQFIGVFNTPEAAHAAYLEVKRRIHLGCTI